MAETQQSPQGGFLPPTPTSLNSPVPDLPGAASPPDFLTDLPHPRSRPLRPNSNKEDMVRNYASAKLMEVARRYVKKFGDSQPGDDVVGYVRFADLCADLDSIINVLWRSGTPILQIQILLRIASEFTEYAPAFPPEPVPTLKLLRKLDHCFASLATGRDLVTSEPLPGFDGRAAAGMTTTDLVRCQSTVENTRALMFSLLGDTAAEEEEEEDVDEDEDGDESGLDGGGGETPASVTAASRDGASINTDVDRIYENSVVAIGERFGGVL